MQWYRLTFIAQKTADGTPLFLYDKFNEIEKFPKQISLLCTDEWIFFKTFFPKRFWWIRRFLELLNN
jgi:hypothetical protein